MNKYAQYDGPKSKFLSMSHVGLKHLEILYIKNEPSLQRTAQRKCDFPTSLSTDFWPWFKAAKKGFCLSFFASVCTNLLTFTGNNTNW